MRDVVGMGPTGEHRILQIHPTRRCNLRCLHCYSSSGPEEGGELSLDLLCAAITAAAREGYTVAGISGGEPLLYKPLPELLEHAKKCGMITTVTSNGMLLGDRRLARLVGTLDLLAISLDGIPSSHNRMRASVRAFETMAAHLGAVRVSGIPFGFIFTLTLHNVHELDWVANFALEQGARLLQIHPLEIVGRASELLPDSRPDDVEGAYAYLEVARIRALAQGRMYVQLDLANRNYLRSQPDRVYAGGPGATASGAQLADLVSPLVIEADGTLVPIQYGFGRKYAFGNLAEASFEELAVSWRTNCYAAFRDLCRGVFAAVTTPNTLPFTNWYEEVGGMSKAVADGARGFPPVLRKED